MELKSVLRCQQDKLKENPGGWVERVWKPGVLEERTREWACRRDRGQARRARPWGRLGGERDGGDGKDWERKGAGERKPGNALLPQPQRSHSGGLRKALPSCRGRTSTSTLTVCRGQFTKTRGVSRDICPEREKAEGQFEKERKT